MHTTRYPLAHRIRVPQPYVPSFSTDVRKTVKAAQRKLVREPEMTLEFGTQGKET